MDNELKNAKCCKPMFSLSIESTINSKKYAFWFNLRLGNCYTQGLEKI